VTIRYETDVVNILSKIITINIARRRKDLVMRRLYQNKKTSEKPLNISVMAPLMDELRTHIRFELRRDDLNGMHEILSTTNDSTANVTKFMSRWT
jgi:hypothetical protein